MPRARFRRFFGWFWFLAGLGTIGVAIAFAIVTETFIHRAAETDGRVISLTPVIDSEYRTVNYAPTFTFGANGHIYTVTSNAATNPPGFKEGETVRVLYDPQNPAHARLKSTAQLWLGSIICAPLGMLFSILGGALLYVDRLRRRQRRVSAGVSSREEMR